MTMLTRNGPTEKPEYKTTLNREELEYFKTIILEKRAAAKKDMDQMKKSISDMRSSASDDSSSIDHHLGDVGSAGAELELLYRLADRTRKFVKQLNRALERIENGSYGICRVTGKPIDKKRLEIAPHTRYSVEAKKMGLDKVRMN